MSRIRKIRKLFQITCSNERYIRNTKKRRKLDPETVFYLQKNTAELLDLTDEASSCQFSLKKLSGTRIIVSDQNLPREFCKRPGQFYIRILASWERNLSDRELLKTEEGMQLQQDLFCADVILTAADLPFQRLFDRVYSGTISSFSQEELFHQIQRLEKNGQIVTEEKVKKYTDRKNILFFVGEFKKNGITSSFLSLIHRINLEKRNYIACFSRDMPEKEKTIFDRLPEEVDLLCIDKKGYTPKEYLLRQLYFLKGIQFSSTIPAIDAFYQRQYRKIFQNIRADVIINYTGYDTDMIRLLSYADKNIIYIHSDMLQEQKLKKAQHLPTLQEYYPRYTAAAAVSEQSLNVAKKITEEKGSFYLTRNLHDAADIRKRAEQELSIQDAERANCSEEELKKCLAIVRDRFITIGRFSKEKGHDMLIRAFAHYQKEYPDSCLILIGGYGDQYDALQKLISQLQLGGKVLLIQSIQNPMPILKRCSLFLLSSLYEGLGLVLLEADTLHLPVLSTNIPGPAEFMQQYGGTLVEASEKGLYEGMLAWKSGAIKVLQIDYDERNQNCEEQFENMLTDVESDAER